MNKWLTISLAILLLAAIFVFARIAGQSQKTTKSIDSSVNIEGQAGPDTVPGSVVSPDADSGRPGTDVDIYDESAAGSLDDDPPVITRRLRIEERQVELPMVDPESIPSAATTPNTVPAAAGGLRPVMPNPDTGTTGAGQRFIEMDLTPISPDDLSTGPGEGIQIAPGPGPGEGFQGVPGPGPGEGDFGVPGPGPGEGDFGVPGPGPGEDGSSGNEQPEGN